MNTIKGEDFPDFAVVLTYFQKFGKYLDMEKVSIKDVNSWLSQNFPHDQSESPHQNIADVLVKLMRKTGMRVGKQQWQNRVLKVAEKYDYSLAVEMQQCGFYNLSPQKKLLLIKWICEQQFDDNIKMKTILNNEETEELRIKPLGRDSDGFLYWYFEDSELNIRLMVEDQAEDDEMGWKVVCRNSNDLNTLLSYLDKSDSNKTKSATYNEEEDLENKFQKFLELECSTEDNLNTKPQGHIGNTEKIPFHTVNEKTFKIFDDTTNKSETKEENVKPINCVKEEITDHKGEIDAKIEIKSEEKNEETRAAESYQSTESSSAVVKSENSSDLKCFENVYTKFTNKIKDENCDKNLFLSNSVEKTNENRENLQISKCVKNEFQVAENVLSEIIDKVVTEKNTDLGIKKCSKYDSGEVKKITSTCISTNKKSISPNTLPLGETSKLSKENGIVNQEVFDVLNIIIEKITSDTGSNLSNTLRITNEKIKNLNSDDEIKNKLQDSSVEVQPTVNGELTTPQTEEQSKPAKNKKTKRRNAMLDRLQREANLLIANDKSTSDNPNKPQYRTRSGRVVKMKKDNVAEEWEQLPGDKSNSKKGGKDIDFVYTENKPRPRNIISSLKPAPAKPARVRKFIASSCEKCRLDTHPDTILLCDECDLGYHMACISPPLMLIPDDDWFCPLCSQKQLVKKLVDIIKSLEARLLSELKRKKQEERKKALNRYVGIHESNIIPATVPANRKTSANARRKSKVLTASSSSENEEGCTTDSSMGEEVNMVTSKRRCKNKVNYDFTSYDKTIMEAIKGDSKGEFSDEEKSKHPPVSGKDIRTIIGADKELSNKTAGRRKKRKLTLGDSDESEFEDSDPSFSLSSNNEDEEEFTFPPESESQTDDEILVGVRNKLRKRKLPTRAGARRRARRKKKYSDSESASVSMSSSSDNEEVVKKEKNPWTKKKRRKANSNSEDTDEYVPPKPKHNLPPPEKQKKKKSRIMDDSSSEESEASKPANKSAAVNADNETSDDSNKWSPVSSNADVSDIMSSEEEDDPEEPKHIS